jgi:hypothetical protein
MKEIDLLRKKFLDKEITEEQYFADMAKVKEKMEEIQTKGF